MTTTSLQIGSRIREIRQHRQLSLSELARRADISKGLLSQVERGIGNVSISVAQSLARELGVPLFTLFVEDDLRDSLVRRQDRQQLVIPGSSAVRELLVPDLRRQISIVSGTLQPGEQSSATQTTHHGEECIVVLRGQIAIEVGSASITLYDGDSYYFEAKTPHLIRNVGDVAAEYLAVANADFGR